MLRLGTTISILYLSRVFWYASIESTWGWGNKVSLGAMIGSQTRMILAGPQIPRSTMRDQDSLNDLQAMWEEGRER